MKNRIIIAILVVLIVYFLFGCSKSVVHTGIIVDETTSTPETDVVEGNDTFSGFDLTTSTPETATIISLNETSVDINGSGAKFENNELIIFESNTFVLKGTLYGTIHILASDQDKIRLVLDNADVYSDDFAALYAESLDKVVITLNEGTKNTFSDGQKYVSENGAEPNACIFSKSDLTINGEGELTVLANCNNAIVSKDDLKIASGSLSITAAKNAIKGKDSVTIGGGTISVLSCKDGIKSDGEKEGSGVVKIISGNIELKCTDDAIQATNQVEISGCKIAADATDKVINCDGIVNIEEECIS